MFNRKASLCLAPTLVLVFVAGLPAWGQDEVNETYDARALVMGTSNPPVIPTGTTAVIQIKINRWSTEEEVDALHAILVEKGHDGLVDALQKQEETGWVRARGMESLTNFPREILRYARQYPMGDKRRIVLALDRPISFAEAVERPRWNRYDMTLIVMDVDSEGRGEGQVAMGARLSMDVPNDRLVIETFSTEPVRLMNVRRIK